METVAVNGLIMDIRSGSVVVGLTYFFRKTIVRIGTVLGNIHVR